jgi:DNA-directed RNA polymerase specialized sigma24 family protein
VSFRASCRRRRVPRRQWPACPIRPARSSGPLPEFRGTASSRTSPEQLDRLSTFVVEQYLAGLSLRQIAELTDRSFSGVRRILAPRGVRRRPAGAAVQRRQSGRTVSA